jgi:hypothetical protein
MPIQKRQHFVPQFYLRNFSFDVNKKRICAAVIDPLQFCPDVSIKSQAYDDYFYGRDGVEDNLRRLEDAASPIVASVIDNDELPPKGCSDARLLLTFVLFQHSRTPAHAATFNEQHLKIAKNVAAGFPDLQNAFDTVALDEKASVQLALRAAAELRHLCDDLECKLLVSTTGQEFITSDHPTAFYNRFLETRVANGGTTALGSKGLQVLFPISPQKALLYFDPNVYRVGGRNRFHPVCRLSDRTDVDRINLLQFANAHKVLYFSAASFWGQVQNIVQRGMASRRLDKVVMDVLPAILSDGSRNGEVIRTTSVDIRIGMDLSFIATRPDAAGRPIDNDPLSVLRDPEGISRFYNSMPLCGPCDPREFLEDLLKYSRRS